MKQPYSGQLFFLVIIAILLFPMCIFLGACFFIYKIIIKKFVKKMLYRNKSPLKNTLNGTEIYSTNKAEKGRVIDHE